MGDSLFLLIIFSCSHVCHFYLGSSYSIFYWSKRMEQDKSYSNFWINHYRCRCSLFIILGRRTEYYRNVWNQVLWFYGQFIFKIYASLRRVVNRLFYLDTVGRSVLFRGILSWYDSTNIFNISSKNIICLCFTCGRINHIEWDLWYIFWCTIDWVTCVHRKINQTWVFLVWSYF